MAVPSGAEAGPAVRELPVQQATDIDKQPHGVGLGGTCRPRVLLARSVGGEALFVHFIEENVEPRY